MRRRQGKGEDREEEKTRRKRKRRGRERRRGAGMTPTWSRAGGTWESISLKSKVLRGLTWLPHAMWTQLGPSGATRLRWVRVRESTERRKHSWDLCMWEGIGSEWRGLGVSGGGEKE